MVEPEERGPLPFRTASAEADSTAALAEAFRAERERLKEELLAHPQGVRACRALTDATDTVIQRLLERALPEEPAARAVAAQKIAIIATGGYGRRELCPYSDIDVTFVVAEEEDPELDATVRQLFRSLMELFGQRLGLKVGYAYRTLADAPDLDHQTQTALLDTRTVAGGALLAERLERTVIGHLWPAAFIRQKVAERRAQLARRGGTIHRVEPDVREGPGGLRDLHLAEWLAAVSFPSTRGDVWRQLQRLGAVSRRDLQQVTAAREFLLTVRNWMHWHTGRAAEGLVRERQDDLAVALGFRDDHQASRLERFMEQYYEHTENVDRVACFVVDRCLAERLSLSEALVCAGGEVLPAYPWIHVAAPQFLMEVCRHYQEHGLTPGHELRRMLAENLALCPDFSADPVAADDFVQLLRARGGVYDTLRMMADLGVLQKLLPEFGEAYRRVPFDQVHQHTIGYHSLEVVRWLERLRFTEEPDLQEYRRLWTAVEAPELLFLGGLLHDIGKLTSGPPGGPDHSETGAQTARELCGRFGLDAHGTAAVELLVRHHLLMSETAQLRDLNLDKTIQDFTREVHTVDLLNMLTLLTYADIAATGVMSAMKSRFLVELYYRAERVLTAGAAAAAPEGERARRFRSRLSRQLAASNLTAEQIREHTEAMPVAYLLNTRTEEIAMHIRMIEALRTAGPVVEFDNELEGDITTIQICTLERPEPGLLSQIAGVLYAHEVSVHGAQVFTRFSDPQIALDTLWADYHGRQIPPVKRLELEQDLVATLKGTDASAVIERRGKQLHPAVRPESVRVDNHLADGHTVIEIVAEDQPGLLYRIARAMAALGWDIHSARISTRGDRARDTFYVTGPDGGKLHDAGDALVDAFLAEFGR